MTTLLRILTLKSRLTDGKFSNQTVETVIAIDPMYLWYVYYNIEKLTFVEEILQAVGITQRIKKPGIDKKLYHKLCCSNIKEQASKMDQDHRDKFCIRQKAQRKKKTVCSYARAHIRDKIFYSKGNMQRRNHGR